MRRAPAAGGSAHPGGDWRHPSSGLGDLADWGILRKMSVVKASTRASPAPISVKPAVAPSTNPRDTAHHLCAAGVWNGPRTHCRLRAPRIARGGTECHCVAVNVEPLTRRSNETRLEKLE